jgi:lipoprotein-anchoring transpeptidase ErfK/SrfK
MRLMSKNVMKIVFIFLVFISNLAFAEVFELPKNGDNIVGSIKTAVTEYGETIPSLSARYDLGYQELISANPDQDLWMPDENSTIILPMQYVLPHSDFNGIVLNLPELRLYYYESVPIEENNDPSATKKIIQPWEKNFGKGWIHTTVKSGDTISSILSKNLMHSAIDKLLDSKTQTSYLLNIFPRQKIKLQKDNKGLKNLVIFTTNNDYVTYSREDETYILKYAKLNIDPIRRNVKVHTFPVSVGRVDWVTPLGDTVVIRKTDNPIWIPPESIKLEHEERGDPLPDKVPPGPDNPLGEHAIYLGIRDVTGGYLFHGTNKPQGIGMRVTHGCIRLRPRDIKKLYEMVDPGTRVRIINEPIKFGVKNGLVYMEVHHISTQDDVPPPVTIKPALKTSNMTAPVSAFIEATEGKNYKIDWDMLFDVALLSRGLPVNIGVDLNKFPETINKKITNKPIPVFGKKSKDII